MSSLSETSSYIQDRLEEQRDLASELTRSWMSKWTDAQELMKVKAVDLQAPPPSLPSLKWPVLEGLSAFVLLVYCCKFLFDKITEKLSFELVLLACIAAEFQTLFF